MKRRKICFAAALIAAAATAAFALDSRLAVRRYLLRSEKLHSPVRLALLTDLHSCKYGAGQQQLLAALRDQAPDLVLMGGDILDDRLPPEPALELLKKTAASFPCYYVTGNHEFWTGRVPEIKAYLAGLGVVVLDGDCALVNIRGQVLNLCGVDDPAAGELVFCSQLEHIQAIRQHGFYTILLSHRPERTGQYLALDVDLLLAGHTHGGQWRIPGLINGLLAPNQGLLPSHAGGLYPLGRSTLIISRGLARESTCLPRIWNRPELVIVDLEPALSSSVK